MYNKKWIRSEIQIYTVDMGGRGSRNPKRKRSSNILLQIKPAYMTYVREKDEGV